MSTFEPTNAALILTLPLSDRSARDRRVWSPDPNGLFTVKSAYKVALDSHSNSNHLSNGFSSQDHFVSL